MRLLWPLLNDGMICLCPLDRPLQCLYLIQLLKHIFFLWPLTSDADIWLIIFIFLLSLNVCYLYFMSCMSFISLYSTLVHFGVF